MKQTSLKKTLSRERKIRYVLIFLLIPFLIASITDDAFSKKKSTKRKRTYKRARTYNPPKTKANAIAILKTSSELSELANIEPTVEKAPESEAYSVDSASILIDTTQLSDVEKLSSYLTNETDTSYIGEEGENIHELEAEDDIKVNLDDFKSIWLLAIGATDKTTTSYGAEKELLMQTIMEWLGTPYRFGGESKKAIDCSAWVKAVFYQTNSINLPRTAREQIMVGNKISRDNLEFGDLVFFHTYSRKFASHVGIYLGDNLFAHASSVAGVTISSLNSTFYANRYIGGRRLNERDVMTYKIANTEAVHTEN